MQYNDQILGVKSNPDGGDENPGQDFILRVVHLIGGQIVIGQMLKRSGGQAPTHMRYPYEVMTIPPSDDGKPVVLVSQFGSCLDMIPGIGLDLIQVEGRMMGAPKYPPSALTQIYLKAMVRRLYPEDAEKSHD